MTIKTFIKIDICRTCDQKCERVQLHPHLCVKCYVRSEIYRARHRNK